MFDATESDLKRLHKSVQRLCAQGRVDDALADAVQAVERARCELGEDHPALAAAREDLARVNEQRVAATLGSFALASIPQELPAVAAQAMFLQSRGRYAEAVPLLERHLQLVVQLTGDRPHPIHAKALVDLAEALWQAGDRMSAQPLLAQALAMYRQSLGDSHPHAAATAHELGRLLLESGDDVQAEPLLQEALDSLRMTAGDHAVETGAALQDLAMVHLHRHDQVAAAPLLQEAFEVYGRPGGEPELRRQIGRLQEQAGRLRQEGRDAEAVPVVEQQLALTRRLMSGDEHAEVASVLNNLALLCANLGGLGDLARAEALMTQAFEITGRTLGESHPDFAMRLNNLGYIRRKLGDYAAAQPLFERALEIVLRVGGDDHPDVATARNNLAGLDMAMGKFAAAEPQYRQALNARRRTLGAAHPAVAELLDNQGQLFFVMGDLPAALRNAEQALEIYRGALGSHHPDVAATLSHVALLRTLSGDPASAQPLLREALRIRRAAFGLWHPAIAQTLGLQAVASRAMGRYGEAQRLTLKVLAIERKVLPANHPLRGQTLHNLAALRLETGQAAAAMPLLECALKLQGSVVGGNDPDRAKSLVLLAWAHAAAGETDDAFELLRQAATIDDRTIGQAFSIGSEVQRMAYAADIWSRCAYLLSLLPHLADRRAAANVGLDLILRRKGLVAESVILQRTAILGGAYPELVPSLKELDGLRARIAAATLGRERAGRDVDAQQVTAWIDRVESLESALARQIPEMTLQQRLRVADRASVAAALPREAVLVEFVRVSPFDFHAVVARGERQWRPARYVAFVLAGDAPDAVQRFDLGEADEIDAKVGAFRESITGAAEPVVPVPKRASPADGVAESRSAIRDATRHLGAARKPKGTLQDAHAQGEALRAVVLDPLLPALGGRTRLVLAPDGDLARVPFEVLPLSATSRMIDVYEISYVTTGRDALRFGMETGARVVRAVVAGDPGFDFGASPDQALGSPFGRLAGSRAEGQQVAAMLGVEPLLADAVLEKPLKAGRGPAILHLATHGFFLPDLPCDANPPGDGMPSAMGLLTARPAANPLLRSGLALAGANTWLAGSDPPAAAEDGLLMAEDVAGMDLLDTELVFLSACDTGLGDIRAGEGVFGLRRAFAQAGARTLVMSLWKVRDHETQELTADFYGRILNGEPRAQALRAAQLTLKTRHPNPLYWGAFICQGDPGPLSAPLCT